MKRRPAFHILLAFGLALATLGAGVVVWGLGALDGSSGSMVGVGAMVVGGVVALVGIACLGGAYDLRRARGT